MSFCEIQVGRSIVLSGGTSKQTDPSIVELLRDRRTLCWALYDWGNSAFATSVMVAFFPIFFNTHWSTGVGGTVTTSRLMIANGIASLLVALSMPLFGAVADRGGFRKAMLLTFAAVGILATAALSLVSDDRWLTASIVFVMASFGFAAGNVFYNAMLSSVARKEQLDRVSAFGFALGYLGGGLLLLVHTLMIFRPSWFLMSDASQATRYVFLTVAVWWGLFTLPLALFVGDSGSRSRQPLRSAIAEGLSQLRGTFGRIRSLRPVVIFLVAYWLYVDGANTLTKAAVDYGYKLNLAPRHLVLAILLVQFVSFPAALGFGALAGKYGAKRCLLIALAIYIAMTCWAGFIGHTWEYFCLAAGIGIGQGGLFSLSRSMYAALIPSEEEAEFFGFYNMIGKFAAVLGPFLVAAAASLTGNVRVSVIVIIPLLLAGGVLLLRVPTSN